MAQSSTRRGADFYILAAFFALFVLFLYGPMLMIFILSFQGPTGGLTFPMRGVSTHWFHDLWSSSRYGDLGGAFRRSLVLGLIQVESGFRKFAVSVAGARGYMQIMPFWTRVIGDGDPGKLFHMQTNLRFGCVILRYYLNREQGDLYLALGRYNGSRGRAEYPNAVFAARKRWQMPAAAQPAPPAAKQQAQAEPRSPVQE